MFLRRRQTQLYVRGWKHIPPPPLVLLDRSPRPSYSLPPRETIPQYMVQVYQLAGYFDRDRCYPARDGCQLHPVGDRRLHFQLRYSTTFVLVVVQVQLCVILPFFHCTSHY